MKRLAALLLAMLILFTGCNAIADDLGDISDIGDDTEQGQIDGGAGDATDGEDGAGDATGDEDGNQPTFDEGPVITEDPYVNVDVDAFYASYTPAVSASDAYFRTLHHLMSGSIAEQDQAPTVSPDRPTSNGRFIRNSAYHYSEDGNTYFVVNEKGEVVNKIFRGGAYVTLEEVAAYVLAFGDIPANYTSSKKGYPSTDPWGKYLRCNNSAFSGDTSRYPYEPVLPRISGCGGDLYYYEIDIGTTGTDCDPSYPVTPYNNGSRITRGAARIVYTRFDANRDNIIDPNEKFLFYTYNHYNDFQEYLNYYGGWGEMFGNITGGGTLSSRTDYAPTPYVPVVMSPLFKMPEGVSDVACRIICLAYVDLSKHAYAA